MRGVWIEICIKSASVLCFKWSLPMRGVWIEIPTNKQTVLKTEVTPHAGSVD